MMRTVHCSGRRGGGGVIPACTGQGGVYTPGGVCLDVCVCVCLCHSMHWAGGVCPGHVCHTPGQTPPPPVTHPPRVNSITDASENITLPQIRCGRLQKSIFLTVPPFPAVHAKDTALFQPEDRRRQEASEDCLWGRLI